MKTMSYLTGNLLVDGNSKIPDSSTLKFVIKNLTDNEVAYNKTVEFDPKELSLFKYLPFEIKDFECDPTKRYSLNVHISQGKSEAIVPGDYIADRDYPIKTGMEELDLQLIKVEK